MPHESSFAAKYVYPMIKFDSPNYTLSVECTVC